ncbi:ssDNA endonuclease and repair protein rad10 [Zalaria obscura]|uniref:SsDNA endonuclease and repair protein rad10 n=1 Tax=Zalaria obscura TaxID=2024903 RepID=A0ACC3S8D8_9PEZI
MDDDFGDDADFAAVAAAVDRTPAPKPSVTASDSGGASASRTGTSTEGAPKKVQQPKPQVLANRATISSILVSPRQKGNPILNNIKDVPWEYSDIEGADYVLGATTCALFLSLKYHRLHPEYIYSRIRQLGQKYSLRIVLVMVDIVNHEESLKELSKTSLINNVTLILAWSAQEAGRYLDKFKSLEKAAPTAIKAQQATSYSDKLVEFVTVPRSINKTDAVGLVSNFGSIRTAVNARPEEIALVAGWGEKKVIRWCQTVREPFRIQRAAKRGLTRENTEATPRSLTRENTSATPALSRGATQAEERLDAQVAARLGVGPEMAMSADPIGGASNGTPDAERRSEVRIADDWKPGEDEEEVFAEFMGAPSAASEPKVPAPVAESKKRKPADEDLSEGVMAALSKLRKT